MFPMQLGRATLQTLIARPGPHATRQAPGGSLRRAKDFGGIGATPRHLSEEDILTLTQAKHPHFIDLDAK